MPDSIRFLLLFAALTVVAACGGEATIDTTGDLAIEESTEYQGSLDERDLLDPQDTYLDGLQIGAALALTENVDLARGQTAMQSTTGYGGIAGRAVDGNAGGSSYSNGSVTATGNQNEPWWQVDLAHSYKLSTIRIWNRADCCAERLANFYVFVANADMQDRSLADLLADTSVWRFHQVAALAANGNITVESPTTGRFVRIQKVDRGILSLAEVKVYGQNIAEGQNATQSTTGYGGVASRGVDGNTNGNYPDGSVTATSEQNEPWWQLDLGEQVSIGRIKLFNRRDCCGKRLSHFYVFVSETDMSQRSLSSLINDPFVWKSFEVAGVGASYLVSGRSQGRFVRIQRNTTGILSLAEVAVYGAPVAQTSQDQLNPAIYGEWSEVIHWPHIAVHAGLLPSGKILSYDATPDDFKPVLDPVASPNDTTRASLWDYVTGIHSDVANDTGDDLFCSGHTLMPDGNYFAAGGTTGYNAPINSTNIFDFQTESWRSGPTMEYRRWYPTVTNLANGELIIAGGRGPYPEIYSPQTGNLRTLKGTGLGATNTSWPFLMQAPNGRVLYAGGAGRRSLSFIDTSGDGQLTETGNSVVDRNRGSFAVYDIGQMLVTGGVGGRKTVGNITMNTARVVAGNPMHLPRQDHNSLVLPNGEVIVVGGNQGGGFCNDEAGSYAPEVWSPTTGQWSLMAAQQHPRQYHSTAILLPDARVWSGGQGYATIVSSQVALCSYQNNAEIFSPPYLYNPDGTAAQRPSINAVPETIKHGEAFDVDTPDAATIDSISLIRLSTATHATNFSQRLVPLVFRTSASDRLSVDAPIDPNVAPSGYYMMFLLNGQGTPSVAKILKLGDSQTSGLTYTLDFGSETSPLEPGWIRVTPATDTSLVNWRLSTPLAGDRGAANGADRLDRDFVYNSRESQLNVNVGNGVWRVTMGIGDTGGYAHDRVSISAEGLPIHADLTTSGPAIVYIGQDTSSSDPSTSFDVPVTDGVLSINIADQGGSNPHWVLNSLKLELLQDAEIPAPVIQPLTVQPQLSSDAVNFTVEATGLGQLQYSWNFGDNSPATGFSANQSSVSHRYAGPGRYIVTVSVRDASGIVSDHTFTQIIYAAPTATPPAASMAIVEHIATGQIWNVNPDNDTVTAISATSTTVLARIPVGHNPVSLAVSPDGDVWVANKHSSTLSVIDATSFRVTNTIALPVGSAPHGIVFDQTSAYVALEALSKIVKVDVASGQIVDELETRHRPRHLTLSGDRNRLYAAVFITPPLPDENTATPLVQDQNGNHGGLIMAMDTNPLRLQQNVVLQYSDLPQSDESGPGIPNYLGALAISPDGGTARVPSKQDNILNGELRTANSLRFDQAVRAVSSRVNLRTLSEALASRIDHDNASIASQAVFDRYGTYLFTSLEGNRQVAVSDAITNVELFRFDVGRAPQGLLVSSDNTRLYVHNFMDRSVGVYDIAALTNGQTATVSELATVTTVDDELLLPEVLAGKKLFYDARDDRLAAQDYMSCASCHHQGGHDGRVWDFSQVGEGLRNTSTLVGRGGPRHGFLHWTANFDEVQDFEAQIREFAGGAGLMSNEQFSAGTRSQPLGDSKAGISPDLDALAAYVNSLTVVPASPYPARGDEFEQGRVLFEQKNCAACHSGTQFTDSGSGSDVHDVGTIKITSGQRLAAALSGIDTPGLLGVWKTAPYLHDGSAATLEDAIAAHSVVATTAAERGALARFVEGLSGDVQNLLTLGQSSGSPVVDGDRLTIDSADDRLTVPHSESTSVGNGDFALSFWIRLEQDATGQWRSLFHKGASNFERTFAMWLSPNDNRIHYVISTSSRWNHAGSTTSALPLNEWTHIAYVKRGTQLQFYVNGVLDGNSLLSGRVVANFGDIMIGQSPWYQPALSTLGKINLYHRALDQSDIDSILADSPDSSVPPVATNNLLNNGGFEQGKAAWFDCAAATSTSASQDAYQGSGALQVQDAGCIYQEFAVTPGKRYRLSCQAKSDPIAFTSVSMFMYNSNYSELDSGAQTVSDASFQPYEVSITAPVNSSIGSATLYSQNTAVFDNCIVEEE